MFAAELPNPLPELSLIQKKLNKAKEYKDHGNLKFKDGNFSSAKSSYGKALAFITGLPGCTKGKSGFEAMAAQSIATGVVVATPEEEKIAEDLEIILHQNLATCYLKLKNPTNALAHCSKALVLNPKSWKATLRKGEAYREMGRPDEAIPILQVEKKNVLTFSELFFN
jgi:tetratricopeptide (TPR) repeat protein